MLKAGSEIYRFDTRYRDFQERYLAIVNQLNDETMTWPISQTRKLIRFFDDINHLAKLFDGDRHAMDIVLRRFVKRVLSMQIPAPNKLAIANWLWVYLSFSPDPQNKEIKGLFLQHS